MEGGAVHVPSEGLVIVEGRVVVEDSGEGGWEECREEVEAVEFVDPLSSSCRGARRSAVSLRMRGGCSEVSGGGGSAVAIARGRGTRCS